MLFCLENDDKIWTKTRLFEIYDHLDLVDSMSMTDVYHRLRSMCKAHSTQSELCVIHHSSSNWPDRRVRCDWINQLMKRTPKVLTNSAASIHTFDEALNSKKTSFAFGNNSINCMGSAWNTTASWTRLMYFKSSTNTRKNLWQNTAKMRILYWTSSMCPQSNQFVNEK